MKKADKKEKEANIQFKLQPIRPEHGLVINKIYYVVENKRCPVLEKFNELDSNTKDRIKTLTIKMATYKDFKSPIIINHLKGGKNYGEIRPLPHRFFFFQKFGSNIIFFDYVLKKKDSFNDSFYENLNRKKDRYEKAFEEYIKRNG